MISQLCVCDLEAGHAGDHEMHLPYGIEWAWRDRESPTIYPREGL